MEAREGLGQLGPLLGGAGEAGYRLCLPCVQALLTREGAQRGKNVGAKFKNQLLFFATCLAFGPSDLRFTLQLK